MEIRAGSYLFLSLQLGVVGLSWRPRWFLEWLPWVIRICNETVVLVHVFFRSRS